MISAIANGLLAAEAEAPRAPGASLLPAIRDWSGASVLDIAIALAVSALAVAVLIGLRLVLKRVLGDPQEGSLDPRRLLGRLVANTYTGFLVVAACFAVTPFVVEPVALVQLIKLVFTVIAVVQAAIWLREILMALIEHQAAKRQTEESAFASAISVLSWFVNLVVWSLALLLVLDNLGVNVTALIAGLGIGGIAVGLAAQGIISDLFSAISILMDRPFVRGDFIVFGDTMGEVEKIGLKTTRIRALSGEQIIVSNARLLSQEIHNHRRMMERRVQFTIDTALNTPSDKVELVPQLLREAVTAQARVRFDRAHLLAIGETSLRFETVYFVLSRDYNAYMDIHQGILLHILRRIEEEDVPFVNAAGLVRLTSEPAEADRERPREIARAGRD